MFVEQKVSMKESTIFLYIILDYLQGSTVSMIPHGRHFSRMWLFHLAIGQAYNLPDPRSIRGWICVAHYDFDLWKF